MLSPPVEAKQPSLVQGLGGRPQADSVFISMENGGISMKELNQIIISTCLF